MNQTAQAQHLSGRESPQQQQHLISIMKNKPHTETGLQRLMWRGVGLRALNASECTSNFTYAAAYKTGEVRNSLSHFYSLIQEAVLYQRTAEKMDV